MRTPSFSGDVELISGALALAVFGIAAKLISGSVLWWQSFGFFVVGAAIAMAVKKFQKPKKRKPPK